MFSVKTSLAVILGCFLVQRENEGRVIEKTNRIGNCQPGSHFF